jgi:hypothetical protein
MVGNGIKGTAMLVVHIPARNLDLRASIQTNALNLSSLAVGASGVVPIALYSHVSAHFGQREAG